MSQNTLQAQSLLIIFFVENKDKSIVKQKKKELLRASCKDNAIAQIYLPWWLNKQKIGSLFVFNNVKTT